MIVVRAGIEDNLHRYALHNLHIVSRGILGRQKAEAGAAGAGDTVDFAVIFAAVGIDLDGDALSRLSYRGAAFP